MHDCMHTFCLAVGVVLVCQLRARQEGAVSVHSPAPGLLSAPPEWRLAGSLEGEKERKLCTVEPLNKGHFGANNFVPCREVVPISEVK